MPVPAGRLKLTTLQASRWDAGRCAFFPAMNRWATVGRPYGTASENHFPKHYSSVFSCVYGRPARYRARYCTRNSAEDKAIKVPGKNSRVGKHCGAPFAIARHVSENRLQAKWIKAKPFCLRAAFRIFSAGTNMQIEAETLSAPTSLANENEIELRAAEKPVGLVTGNAGLIVPCYFSALWHPACTLSLRLKTGWVGGYKYLTKCRISGRYVFDPCRTIVRDRYSGSKSVWLKSNWHYFLSIHQGKP